MGIAVSLPLKSSFNYSFLFPPLFWQKAAFNSVWQRLFLGAHPTLNRKGNLLRWRDKPVQLWRQGHVMNLSRITGKWECCVKLLYFVMFYDSSSSPWWGLAVTQEHTAGTLDLVPMACDLLSRVVLSYPLNILVGPLVIQPAWNSWPCPVVLTWSVHICPVFSLHCWLNCK